MTLEEIKTALGTNAAERAKVDAQIAEYGERNCAAVVRLHDRKWDLEARNMMLCRMFDMDAS